MGAVGADWWMSHLGVRTELAVRLERGCVG